jgi:ribonuclease HI
VSTKKVYVVTAPDSIRGIYDTWAACEAVVRGKSGARFQAVRNRAEADAMLDGGVILPDGLYAFTDGGYHPDTGSAGVGVVIVGAEDGETIVLKAVGKSVVGLLHERNIKGLETDRKVISALRSSRNHIAEQAAVYLAVRKLPRESDATIVHDLVNVAGWMTNGASHWPLITEARRLARKKGLDLTFLHQHGHRSTWAGRHDFAEFNMLADDLAREAMGKPPLKPLLLLKWRREVRW